MTRQVPKRVKCRGTNEYWIPPFPPHWDMWMGPYDSVKEIEADRRGLEYTINSTEWTLMLEELKEEFEEQWNRKRLAVQSSSIRS